MAAFPGHALSGHGAATDQAVCGRNRSNRAPQQRTKAVVALRPAVDTARQPITTPSDEGQITPFLAGRPEKAEPVATDHQSWACSWKRPKRRPRFLYRSDGNASFAGITQRSGATLKSHKWSENKDFSCFLAQCVGPLPISHALGAIRECEAEIKAECKVVTSEAGPGKDRTGERA